MGGGLTVHAQTQEQREIVALVREFVDREVVPQAPAFDHDDVFPGPLVERMRELGLFGITIPEEHGGLGLDVTTYALVQVELSRGWMSLSGVLNTHLITARMIATHGTDEQRARLLPHMATGEWRAAYSMTEPHAGSDVQAIRTTARREGDDWVIDGQKMWVTNGLRSSLVCLLVRTDPEADPPHRGMTAFVVHKPAGAADVPGLTIAKLEKLGYKGVESTELAFDGFRTPASSVLGGEEGLGRGFAWFMEGIELGRINVAARGVGIATAALEASLRYARERETFGKPIAEHQAIQLKLADMATRIQEAALEAMRIHGGYGYSPEFVVERLYRDAPVLVIGEGTNEIQRLVIARRLLERAEASDPGTEARGS